MEPLSEATHALLTTETCDPVLSVNDTGGSTDAVGLGVSGNPPVTNGDLAQTERALLDQGSEKVKTNFLELNDQQPPVNVPPSEIQPQITMTNLTGSVEDKTLLSVPGLSNTLATSPALLTSSNGHLHPTPSLQSPPNSSSQLIRSTSKQLYSPKAHTRSSTNYSRGQGHTPRGAVMPSSMYYRYIPIQIPGQPIYYQQPTAGTGSRPHHQQPGLQGSEQLSSTNLYIRGLSRICSDDDLMQLCKGYGRIVSTKSILDKNTSLCKGYGFVDFENPSDATRACQSLQAQGIIVQFAKVPQQDQDPTNLYMSNLPADYDEKMIESLISPYGKIVSTRILRDHAMNSRGVGFARMDTKESCEKVIGALNGALLHGGKEPLTIKFADSSNKRKQTQNRWRDAQQQQYMYETPQVIPQNGLVGSRGIVQHFTAPYVQTAPQAIQGYQVPPVSNISSAGWSPAAYFMQPTPTVGSSDVSALTGQMGGLQMGSTTGYAAVQPQQQYHLTPHGTQYAISHQGPTYLSQDHSAVADHIQTSGADSRKHHVQVITQGGESTDDHTVHLYYPTSTWTGK